MFDFRLTFLDQITLCQPSSRYMMTITPYSNFIQCILLNGPTFDNFDLITYNMTMHFMQQNSSLNKKTKYLIPNIYACIMHVLTL